MTYGSSGTNRMPRLRRLAAVLGLVAAMVGLQFAPTAHAAPGNFAAPFNPDETWVINQGYRSGTHAGGYALDLTVSSSARATAGRTVRAPDAGTIAYWQPTNERGQVGNLCVNMPDGKSYALTHIAASVTSGAVQRGQAVGTVLPPNSANNNISHLHFGAWSGHNCYGESPEIPFDASHGTQICGAPNLTASGPNGGNGIWSGTRITARSCGNAVVSDEGAWVLTNSLRPHVETGNRVRFAFGRGYVALAGDWNGDDRDTPAVFRPSTGAWVLSNSARPDIHTSDRIRFNFGDASYIPIKGDWNGDGRDTPGLFRPSTGRWILTNSSRPDIDTGDRIRFTFGDASYEPVAGDWNRDRRDSPGLFRPSTGRWVLTDSLRPDVDATNRRRFTFGNSSYLPVAGDWDGSRGDNPGLFRPSTGAWVLTNSLQPDVHTGNRVRFTFGSAPYQPIAGDWDGSPGDNPGVVR